MAGAKRPATPADILDGHALPGIQRLDLPPGVRPVMTARCGARPSPPIPGDKATIHGKVVAVLRRV